MKRMHIHVGVDKLEPSIDFYNALLGKQPTKVRNDYAKWMLDDPRINFAISTRANRKGVHHLGIQVDDGSDLDRLRGQLAMANMTTFDEGDTRCCYAHSDKSWVKDPVGVAWEVFHTMQDVEHYYDWTSDQADACCTAETKGQPGCCKSMDSSAGCCTA